MSAQGTQIGQLSSSLEAFGLKHAAKALPDQLEIAERNELSSRQFLASLLAVESDGRFARKRRRNYASAHFPPNVRPIDEFDCSELEGCPYSFVKPQMRTFQHLGPQKAPHRAPCRA